MTEHSPVAALPPAPDSSEDDEDYGKSILGELRKLNGRLDGWDGHLTRETQTETSSDPETPPAPPEEMNTRASAPETPPAPNANSQTSESASSAAPVGDSSPGVDPTPPPPTPEQKTQRQNQRKGLGFLKGGKRKT